MAGEARAPAVIRHADARSCAIVRPTFSPEVSLDSSAELLRRRLGQRVNSTARFAGPGPSVKVALSALERRLQDGGGEQDVEGVANATQLETSMKAAL